MKRSNVSEAFDNLCELEAVEEFLSEIEAHSPEFIRLSFTPDGEEFERNIWIETRFLKSGIRREQTKFNTALHKVGVKL